MGGKKERGEQRDQALGGDRQDDVLSVGNQPKDGAPGTTRMRQQQQYTSPTEDVDDTQTGAPRRLGL